jgi:G3E family GTPase
LFDRPSHQWIPPKVSKTHDLHGIAQFCLQRFVPVDLVKVDYWLRQITGLRGHDVLRIKGLLHTTAYSHKATTWRKCVKRQNFYCSEIFVDSSALNCCTIKRVELCEFYYGTSEKI